MPIIFWNTSLSTWRYSHFWIDHSHRETVRESAGNYILKVTTWVSFLFLPMITKMPAGRWPMLELWYWSSRNSGVLHVQQDFISGNSEPWQGLSAWPTCGQAPLMPLLNWTATLACKTHRFSAWVIFPIRPCPSQHQDTEANTSTVSNSSSLRSLNYLPEKAQCFQENLLFATG